MRRHLFLILGLLAAGACSSNNDRHGSGRGTFSLTWDLTDAIGQINCGDVDAVTLQLTSHPVGSGVDVLDRFDCGDFRGTTDPLPEGDYHLKIDLLDSNDAQLNDVQPNAIETIIEDTNLSLGNFVFDFGA